MSILFNILNILKQHSDEEHRLTQNQIKDLMESEYKMKIDRKTVRRNLSKLMEDGFPISYRGSENEDETIIRKRKNGYEETILTDWYYIHEISNGELRLLINSVLLSDGLSKRHRLDLIHKLEKLSNKYFRSVTSKIDMDIYGQTKNMQIFMTLENIDNAIVKGKQLAFNYCSCAVNGKLTYRLDSSGKKKQYIVNPYQLISKNGHTYLICNLTQYDTLTHFRVDRIKESLVLDTPLKPLRTLKGFESGIRLSEYVKEHPNLWSGNAVRITFKCRQYMMNDIADSFGTDLRIEELPDDMILVHVHASEAAMLHWAIQFADDIEVLSPKNLREQIADTLRNALKKYED